MFLPRLDSRHSKNDKRIIEVGEMNTDLLNVLPALAHKCSNIGASVCYGLSGAAKKCPYS